MESVGPQRTLCEQGIRRVGTVTICMFGRATERLSEYSSFSTGSRGRCLGIACHPRNCSLFSFCLR